MLREGMSLIAPVTAGLGLILWMAPPQPWAGVRWTSGPPGDLPKQFYTLLFFASLIGAGAVGLGAQFLRRRQRTTAAHGRRRRRRGRRGRGLAVETGPSRPDESSPGRRGEVV